MVGKGIGFALRVVDVWKQAHDERSCRSNERRSMTTNDLLMAWARSMEMEMEGTELTPKSSSLNDERNDRHRRIECRGRLTTVQNPKPGRQIVGELQGNACRQLAGYLRLIAGEAQGFWHYSPMQL
jgi:hypothetical protein